MRRVLDFLLSWLSVTAQLFGLRREIGYLDKKITRMRQESSDQLIVLGHLRDELIRRLKDYETETSRVVKELDTANETIRQLEVTMEAARERARIAEEVTIPSLVAAHELVLKRNEADTAIQVARGVLGGPPERTA